MPIHGETDVLFSLNPAQPLINLKMKLNAVKLVLMFQSLFLSLCFHSQVAKNPSLVMKTFMERLESDSLLNGKLLPQDGNKKINSQSCQPHSQHINDRQFLKLFINQKLF